MTAQTLAIREEPLTVEEVKAQVNLIKKVLDSVMIKDVHYGVIPGCKKPCLYKPGAEKIMVTFRMAADPTADDLSTPEEIRYRARVIITTASGRFLGAGIGECSSNEDKYKWRKAVCNEEWEETPEDRRREKWYKGYKGEPNYQVKQVRTEIADVANTILKMAKKRGLVDGCLTTTACSDIFDQDLEDLPEGTRENGQQQPQGKPDVKKPQSKSGKKQSQTQNGGEAELREELKDMIKALAGEEGDCNDLLEQYTSFEGDDGETKAVRNLKNLKGNWLFKTHIKVKKDWETAGFDKGTSDDIPDWNEETQ